MLLLYSQVKATPTIDVTGATVDYGQAATVTVTVMDGETPVAGNAVVTVNGVDYAVTVGADGKGTVTIANLPNGTYDVAAKFLANDIYDEAVYSGDAKVVVGPSKELTLTVTANEPTVGEDTIITVTAADASGTAVPVEKVNVTVNGETTEYTVGTDGTVNIGKLPVGETPVTVAVNDGVHDAATKDVTAKVAPKDTASVTVGSNAENITIEAKDGTTPLNGTALVSIDGATPIEVPVGEDGKANVPLDNLAPGQHTLEVKFTNDNYEPVTEVATITVPKGTAVINVTGDAVDYGADATVTVTVMDGTSPVAGNAVVTVNGVDYAVTVGADGKGTVTIAGLASNEYPITAKFLANDNYEEAVYSGDAKVVVNMPTDVTFDLAVDDDLTTITVSDAKDASGNEIDGYIMAELFKDGQKVANLDMGNLADGTGTIALPADLTPGEYTVMVNVTDEEMELTGTDEIKFTVEPKAAVVLGDVADYAFDQTGKLEINVTDVDDAPLTGTVTVVVDEGVYAVTDISGSTVVDLTGLAIGNHIVKVVFNATNYRDSEWLGGFAVTKATPVLTVTGTEVEYGTPATVTVKLADANGNPITGDVVVIASWIVDGETQLVELAANGTGEATFTLAGVAEGSTVDVKAIFFGDDTYAAVNNTDAKIIIKDSTKSNIEVTANEPAYGEDAIITVTVKDGSGAVVPAEKVNVTINGETKELPVADDGTVNLGKLPAGDTEITVSYDDGVHEEAVAALNVTVSPAAGVQVDASAANYAVGGTGSLVITVKDIDGNALSGTAYVEIDGEIYALDVEVNNGQATVDLTGLDVGDHVAKVTFSNDNYLTVDYTTHFTVTKATPAITVTGSEVDFGQDATVTVTVMNGTTPVAGNAVVTVDGVDYAVTVGADGKGTVTIAGLASNEYPITAKFLANDKYEEASYSGDAKVVVGPSKDLTIKVTDNAPTTGEDAIITVTATDGSGANVPVEKVNVTINGETKELPVADDGTVNLGKLPAGENEVTVSVNDGTHNLTTETKTVVVKDPAAITTDTIVTVSAKNITYGGKAVINFTLTDVDGNKLSGVLNVTVGDQVKPVTVTNGVGTLTVSGLNAGNYTAVANYEGSNTYAASTGEGSFNVAKLGTKIIYKNMVTKTMDFVLEGRHGEYFVWTLTDVNGKALANKYIQIGFNGKIYNRTTDANGKAKLQINLRKSDNYTFAICFLGDENYDSSFVVAKITVNVQTPKLTVPKKTYKAAAKTKKLTATFKTARGTVVKGQKITFTVNGKTYTATTNKKGVATVKVSLKKKGTYKVTAKFAGDITYKAITKTSKLVIK